MAKEKKRKPYKTLRRRVKKRIEERLNKLKYKAEMELGREVKAPERMEFEWRAIVRNEFNAKQYLINQLGEWEYYRLYGGR